MWKSCSLNMTIFSYRRSLNTPRYRRKALREGCPWGWGCTDALGGFFGTKVGRAWARPVQGEASLPQDHGGSGPLLHQPAHLRRVKPAVVCAGTIAGGWKWDILSILHMASRAGLGQKDVQESGLTLQKRRTQCCVCHMGSSNHKQ